MNFLVILATLLNFAHARPKPNDRYYNVICTVSFADETGYLHVVSATGFVIKEGAKGMQERLYVNFGEKAPFNPKVIWVDENDCLYEQDTDTKFVNRETEL